MTKRRSISKRIRFDLFKRDNFTCQYCGGHPPNVILHIDHIVAVANGGNNDPDNLVTACDTCNMGKAAVPLTTVPETLADKAASIAEREAQLRGFYDVIEAKRQRIDNEMWHVANTLINDPSIDSCRRDWLQSIKRFLDLIGYHQTLDAADIAVAKCPRGSKRTFLYFCGICWNKARGSEHG